MIRVIVIVLIVLAVLATFPWFLAGLVLWGFWRLLRR